MKTFLIAHFAKHCDQYTKKAVCKIKHRMKPNAVNKTKHSLAVQCPNTHPNQNDQRLTKNAQSITLMPVTSSPLSQNTAAATGG